LVDDDARVIFCGDHLLPTITPNIGLYPECRPNPLEDFLWSLGRFEREAAYTVLPGHGESYTALPERIGQFRKHHDERLTGIRTKVADSDGRGVTALEVVQHFWGNKLSTHEIRFAMVEVVAHLEYMRLRGELEASGSDGTQRYKLA
jgi:glyoxylase-like metal-dependent hydrolase (beta-lactamase superfamily II)